MSKNDALKKVNYEDKIIHLQKKNLQIYKTRNCNLEICEKRSVSWRKN